MSNYFLTDADRKQLEALIASKANKAELINGAHIEMGTYIGTGTEGSGNKNTLTFNRKPIMLFINDPYWGFQGMFARPGATRKNGIATSWYISASSETKAVLSAIWDDKSVSWYCGDTVQSTNVDPSKKKLQLNAASNTYYYAAVCID